MTSHGCCFLAGVLFYFLTNGNVSLGNIINPKDSSETEPKEIVLANLVKLFLGERSLPKDAMQPEANVEVDESEDGSEIVDEHLTEARAADKEPASDVSLDEDDGTQQIQMSLKRAKRFLFDFGKKDYYTNLINPLLLGHVSGFSEILRNIILAVSYILPLFFPAFAAIFSSMVPQFTNFIFDRFNF